MNFHESETYLLSLGNEVETMKLGLENIRRLLAALGNPQNNYLKVQVAGTNGKGSVCAFLDSICLEAAISTGLYTSPHLVSITERIKIGGKDIIREEFARLATRVRETSESLVADGKLERVPTYFEQVTAMALQAFADAKVELAILETGLGGRYDATTAANAEIAAITRIDLDHQEYLGDTIEEIAAEKAAIIRPNTRAMVIGDQKPEVDAVINSRIANLVEADTWQIVPIVYRPSEVSRYSETNPFDREIIGLPGRHQIENARIAILLSLCLQDGFSIREDNILSGLANVRHQGRLEYDGRYLFDGAHNINGAIALAFYLIVNVDKPLTMIFASMREKDVREIAVRLFPIAENVVLTRPDNSRAMSAGEIAAVSRDLVYHDRFFLTESVAEAIKKAEEISGEDSIILVTGSLYLVGEAKRILSSQI